MRAQGVTWVGPAVVAVAESSMAWAGVGTSASTRDPAAVSRMTLRTSAP